HPQGCGNEQEADLCCAKSHDAKSESQGGPPGGARPPWKLHAPDQTSPSASTLYPTALQAFRAKSRSSLPHYAAARGAFQPRVVENNHSIQARKSRPPQPSKNEDRPLVRPDPPPAPVGADPRSVSALPQHLGAPLGTVSAL